MNDQAQKLRHRFKEKINSRAKTVAVVSGKGGVGKSNFAINFALELLARGKKVLIFDLDVGMGNIDILLGLHSEKTIIDMLEKYLFIDDIIECGPNNLAYVSGGSGLSHFFQLDDHKKAHFFKEYEKIVNVYDYIIFDMGAGITPESLSFILAADECLVITTPEPTSLTDGYGMIKHIVNNQKNMPIYVVMNRCHSSKDGKITLNKFKEVAHHFLEKEINGLGYLPEDKIVSTAVKRQTPYVLLDNKAKISQAMHQMVSNYLSESLNINKHQSLSFMEKLKQLIKVR